MKMKLFALLFLFGCAVANQSELRWQVGKQYAFEYSGRLLTGLPQLAPHYSGLGIKATILVDVLSQTKLQLSLENPHFARVNERLEARMNTMDGVNWRKILLPEMTVVEPQVKKVLELPVVIDLLHGEIQEVKVSPEEPVWSVNLKKALAVLFQTKFDAAAWLPEENQISTSYTDNFWKTKEASMDGMCEVTYQINELPKYMVFDKPELIPFPQLCTGQRYYELVKTKNLDNCERRPAMSFYKPGVYRKDMWTRTSETRFIACGQRGNLMLQTIVNQGEINLNALGYKTERFVSGNMQSLSLKEIRNVAPKPLPAHLMAIVDMGYVFFPVHLMKQTIAENQQQSKLELAAHNKAKVIPQVKQMLSTIMVEMKQPNIENMSEKQLALKFVTLAHALVLLEKADLEAIYQELKVKFVADVDTFRPLYYDIVLMSGSPDAIRFLKAHILNNEMTKIELISLVYLLPNNVVVPSTDVLEELFDLVISPKIKENRIYENLATMSFTTLLEKACFARNRDTAYPTAGVGPNVCAPDSDVVMKKWVPYLLQQLQQKTTSWERKNEIIAALGMLPRQEIVGKLIPFVEGRLPGTEVPTMTRMLAVWSLASAGRYDPQIVEPIFFSLYANPGESTEIRIAGFSALMKLNPSMTVFNKIVARTWTEQDQEVLKVVNAAMYTLAHQSAKATPMDTLQVMVEMAKKAKMAYPLMKKIEGVIPTSGMLYTSDYLPKLGVGYEGLTSWIASQKSRIPVGFWTEMTYMLSQFEVRPLAAGLRVAGIENIYQKLEESVNVEWRQIIQKLNIKPLQEEHMSGSLYVRALEATPILASIEKLTFESLKEKINSLFTDVPSMKAALAQEHAVSIKRAVQLASVMNTVPTDMGLPVEFHLHLPLVLSVEGKVKMEPRLSNPALKLSAKIFATMQYTGYVGTIIPFTGERAVTAVDQTSVYNIPATVMVNVDVPKQHARIVMKIDEALVKPVDIVHFHNHPFSTIHYIHDLTPITLSPNKKMIRSQDELKEIKKSFGEVLGLHFTAQMRSESTYVDLKSVIERLALYKYNPINMIRYASALALDNEARPSFRRHEISLTYDPTQSTTKQLALDFKLGFASKAPDAPVQYHKLKILSPAEQTSLVKKPFWTRWIPVSYESQEISAKSFHPARQEKLEKIVKSIVEPVESAKALTIKVSATLQGSRALSYSYWATVVGAQKPEVSERKTITKYFIELASEQCLDKVVVQGRIQSPVLPVWDIHAIRSSMIDYRFFNSIAYFPGGVKKWSVDIQAQAKTSPEQKELSTHYVGSVAQELARALDEVEISFTWNNIPTWMRTLEAQSTFVIKTLMWPFLKANRLNNIVGNHVGPVMHTSARLQFNRETPTFNLIIVRPTETIEFRQIRLPYPLEFVLPLKGGMNNVKLAAQKLTGYNLYPVCEIVGQDVTSFDHRRIPFPVDPCFTLVTGDCNPQGGRFGILSRNLKSNMREVLIYLGPAKITLTPVEGGEVKVLVDGVPMEIPSKQWVGFPIVPQVPIVGEIYKYNNVINIFTPEFELTFTGTQLYVEVSPVLVLRKNMCGVCGPIMEGPQKCMYSKPEVEAAAYRIPDLPLACDAEKPLTPFIKERLQLETQQCLKKQFIPTKISKSLRTQNGQCTILKHAVIKRPGQICISKKPVTQCAAGCQPSHPELLEKNIPFSCLKEDRVAEHYVKKAERGERMAELDARKTTFETKVPQPRSCVSASNEL